MEGERRPEEVNNAEGNHDDGFEVEWANFVAEQLVEWNVSQEELFRLVSAVNHEFNESSLRGNPLVQPAIMRCLANHLDFETIKSLRLSVKLLRDVVDCYFYQRGNFKVNNSTEYYKFIKSAHAENYHIASKIRIITFSDDIDLFEISRIMYRARANLKELSIYTTAPKLRGEFQNIAAVLPLMAELHTFRLTLPRRYLLHPLFRNVPLPTIKTLRLNFQNAHPDTVKGVFSTCTRLEYLEVMKDQLWYLSKLAAVVPIDLKRMRPTKSTTGIPSRFYIFKITRRERCRSPNYAFRMADVA